MLHQPVQVAFHVALHVRAPAPDVIDDDAVLLLNSTSLVAAHAGPDLDDALTAICVESAARKLLSGLKLAT